MAISREISLGSVGEEFATSGALKPVESDFVEVPSVAMVLLGREFRALHGCSSYVPLFQNKNFFSSAALTN